MLSVQELRQSEDNYSLLGDNLSKSAIAKATKDSRNVKRLAEEIQFEASRGMYVNAEPSLLILRNS